MLEIIKPKEVIKEHAYRRIFQGDHECHGFLCDEDGNPLFRSPREKLMYDKCFTNPNRYTDCGRVLREYTKTFPARAICECGSELTLEKTWGKDGITCICGKVYTPEGAEIQ